MASKTTQKRACNSSRDMIQNAEELTATSCIPYLALRQFESAVYFMAGNLATLQDIRSRRSLSPKQEDFAQSLEQGMPNMTSYVAYCYDKAQRQSVETSGWIETVNRAMGLASEEELRGQAETRYESLPSDQSEALVDRFVNSRMAKQDALAANVYKSIEIALKEGGDQPWELSPQLTRVILRNFLRYAEDNSDVEVVEKRAEEVGLPDTVVDEIISMIPVMEHAIVGLNDMIRMLDEHIEQAGNAPFNGMH